MSSKQPLYIDEGIKEKEKNVLHWCELSVQLTNYQAFLNSSM